MHQPLSNRIALSIIRMLTMVAALWLASGGHVTARTSMGPASKWRTEQESPLYTRGAGGEEPMPAGGCWGRGMYDIFQDIIMYE